MLESEKPGDNAQLRIVSEALGEPFERRFVAMLPRYRTGKPRVRPSLHHLDREASDALEAPWPRLVLCAGRRPSMVALWIKEQSGGRTKIAILGRPRRLSAAFDLAIVPGQHRASEAANVLPISLPLLRLDPSDVAEEAERWKSRFAALPRPLTGVLVGGPIRQGRMGVREARDLLAGVRAATRADPGTLCITTSRRTPAPVVALLESEKPAGSWFHRWSPDGDPVDNPYRALLGTAERFVVTADSLSMMIEVARLRRSLSIFPLPPTPWTTLQRLVGGRSLHALPHLLMERGLATPFGEALPVERPDAPVPDDLPRVVERLRALLASRA